MKYIGDGRDGIEYTVLERVRGHLIVAARRIWEANNGDSIYELSGEWGIYHVKSPKDIMKEMDNMTMAEKCLAFIRQVPEDYILDEWEDVFRRYAGQRLAPWLVDEDATSKADKAGNSDIVVFKDGSRLVFDETTYKWKVG